MAAEAQYDLTGRPAPWPADLVGMWRQAMTRALSEAPMTRRSPPGGDGLLRESLAALLGRPARHLIVTAGVRCAATALLNRHSAVVVDHMYRSSRAGWTPSGAAFRHGCVVWRLSFSR